MAEEALIEGVVVGDLGVPVAGYVKLGANGARHAIAETVIVRTDAGHDVELIELTPSTIDPVVTQRAAWHELEREPGANACVADAPAPDVEVELFSALLRGGDRIAAWGPVREHVLDGGTSSAYREGAVRRVVTLAPVMVFVGDRCVERLERLRATPAFTPLRPPEPPRPQRESSGWHELRTKPLGLWVMVPLVLIFGVLAFVPRLDPGALAITGGALALPLATFTAAAFHEVGRRTEESWSVVLGILLGFSVLIGAALVLAGFKAALVSAFVALVLACVLIRLSGRRRRLLRLVLGAPAHASPIVPGVWGALDGLVRVGEGSPRFGEEGCALAYGIKHATDDVPLEIVKTSGDVHVGATRVLLTGALWMSTTSRMVESSQGPVHVDVVRDGANVRVVGRAQDGVIAKGGEESLLIFASDVDGDPVAFLRRLLRWEKITLELAGIGIAVMTGALLLAAIR